jgi:hypothetical protein
MKYLIKTKLSQTSIRDNHFLTYLMTMILGQIMQIKDQILPRKPIKLIQILSKSFKIIVHSHRKVNIIAMIFQQLMNNILK